MPLNINSEKIKRITEPLTRAVAYVVLALGLMLVSYKLIPWLVGFVNAVILERWLRDVVGTLLVFLVGIILYIFRRKRLLLYAKLEVAFALTSTWLAINNIEDKPDMTTYLTLAGAIYLIVRGLDNYKKGKDEIQFMIDDI